MIPLAVVVAVVVGVIVVVVAVVVLPYLLSSSRNRRVGGRGFVQESRLTCPKCHRPFDYRWIPGAALTAVRLGKSRYMACPLCHKWSTFDVWDSPPPRTEPPN
jgi:hypothetical protein